MSTAADATPDGRIVYLQQAALPNGERPHRMGVDGEGRITDQDFWQGTATELVGFAPSMDARITLMWSVFLGDPHRAIGMYPVLTGAESDRWWYGQSEIATVQIIEPTTTQEGAP